MSEANPVLIEVLRGRHVESRHRGAAAVVGADGRIMAAWGDAGATIFPRSTAKPLQALAWLEGPAGHETALSPAEVAIACGSHHGQPHHIACVEVWLARIGCREAELVCGPHPPLAEAAAEELVRSGQRPRRLHNNCSGKHAGFLAACRAAGLPIGGYQRVDHPLQEAVRRVLAEMAGAEVATANAAVDGCGVPVYPLPLVGLATAYARLTRRKRLGPARATAVQRILDAMTACPAFVSGSDGFDFQVMAAAGGAIICKGGAEGMHAALLPEAGLGLAVKIDDGARRAAEAAMAALLLRFGTLPPAVRRLLEGVAWQPLRNAAGEVVGELRPAAGWLAS